MTDAIVDEPPTRREHAESLAWQIIANGSPLAPLAEEFLALVEREQRERRAKP